MPGVPGEDSRADIEVLRFTDVVQDSVPPTAPVDPDITATRGAREQTSAVAERRSVAAQYR